VASAAALAPARPSPLLRRAPRILPPTNAARDYLQGLLRVVELTRDAVDKHVLQPGGGIEAARAEVAEQLEPAAVRRLVRRVAATVDAHNRAQVAKQVRAVFQLEPTDDGDYTALLRAWRRENIALSTRVAADFLDGVARIAGVRGDKAEDDELRKGIDHEHRKARNRAAFIAEDQTGTLNGKLTGRRHRDLGVVRYRWRNSRDERVRGRPDGRWPNAKHSHWSREAQIFEDAKPPEDGHPGEPPRCRCWREPVFEDLLGPEFAVNQAPAPIASAARGLKTRRPGAARPQSGPPTAPKAAPVDPTEAGVFRVVDAWVHGSKSKASVTLKHAAIEEFGLKGVAFTRRQHLIDPRAVARDRRIARELYRRTQEYFRKRGIKTVRLYRGIKEQYAQKGALESWTTDPAQARRFAAGGHILVMDVPVDRILTGRGIPGWHDGRFGNQSEMVVMF
jgi:hypothetical protein